MDIFHDKISTQSDLKTRCNFILTTTIGELNMAIVERQNGLTVWPSYLTAGGRSDVVRFDF